METRELIVEPARCNPLPPGERVASVNRAGEGAERPLSLCVFGQLRHPLTPTLSPEGRGGASFCFIDGERHV